MKRLFIAIEIIPDSNFTKIYSKIKSAATKLDSLTWVKPDLVHITVQFLGVTPAEKIPDIVKGMESAVVDISSFQLKIGSIGVFGSRYCPRVLWFGIENSDFVQQLHQQIQKQMRRLGFKTNFGNFVPHLTIARIHKIDNKRRFRESVEAIQTPFIQEITVDKIILYESILKTHIPVYQKTATTYFTN
jgi:2'-5' RNA ligase